MHNLVTHRDAGPAHTLAIEMAVHTAEDIADMGESGLKRRGTAASADIFRNVEEDADGRENGVDKPDKHKASAPQPTRDPPPLSRRASTLTTTGSQKIFADYEAKTRKRARELKRSKYLLDPRTSKLMPNWDVVTSIALIFTAIMTPVEVGFMDIPADRWADGLFITNRCVDIIFILDVLMQFFIMCASPCCRHAVGSPPLLLRELPAHPRLSAPADRCGTQVPGNGYQEPGRRALGDGSAQDCVALRG